MYLSSSDMNARAVTIEDHGADEQFETIQPGITDMDVAASWGFLTAIIGVFAVAALF